ncbi:MULTISPECIES: hypothetical protein [Metallosphaera]|uniref:hypothetical protein n=1 Tax=Metallosphaera TaxID=41980 RepID=UPI001F05D551|nr:hypothetical protein [Metallosphaera sedula]MCH1771291.1 hypothetical protein [Metallosphaera sedula]MCP6729681.1 hypothetical protein [Metallosphaera sedula]
MDATIIYYDPVTVPVFPDVSLIGIKYEREEKRSVNSVEEMEQLAVEGKVVLVRAKGTIVLNIGLKVTYPFNEIVNVKRVGVPREFTNDGVKVEYKEVLEPYGYVGVNINFSPSLPFIIVETEQGGRIISLSSIQDTKPEVPRESKTPEKKRKKRAKKSRKRRKVKSKGSRKSRGV